MAKKSVSQVMIRTVLLYSAVLRSLAFPALRFMRYLNILLLIQEYNDRRIQCALLSLDITLPYNCRSNGRPAVLKIVNELIAAGYVVGKTTGYHITELGRARLASIDAALWKAKVRVLKADKLM